MEDLHLYILLLGLAWSIFNRYLIPKINNLPPTPLSALTVIGYLAFFKQPIHRTLHHIATRHGPILLLHFGVRRVLLISSSSAAEELFSKNKNDVVFAHRPKLVAAKVFGRNYRNLAWAPHGVEWRHLRRVSCLEVLPFHRKQEQDESLTDEVKLLLGRLKFFHEEKKDVELKPLIMDLVINVMMKMFGGKGFCPKTMTIEEKGKKPICMKDYVSNSFTMTTDELDGGYFMPILKLVWSSLEQSCKELQEQGDILTHNLIKQIRTRMADINGSDKKEVKVIEFLLARQKEDPKLYSDERIVGLVQVLMSAGTDTTVGVLEWAFCLLLNHPEVLQKAQKEIENHVGNERFLKQSDIEKLPYLRCIVKETLRMYPVAPLLVPHESSRECTIGGYVVPPRTMLMVNAWAIHNDPKIWDEPEIFMPERFEKIVDERNGFKLMPFGYGRRSCPGKHMAMSVITFVLGSLLQTFDWERVSHEKKAVDMTELTRLALFKAKPLKAVCHPRESMKDLFSQIKRVDVKENNHPCMKEVKNYVVYIALGLFVIMLAKVCI